MLQKIELEKFQDKIEWLWDKVKEQEYAFDDTVKGNSQAFLTSLFRFDSAHWYRQEGMVSVTGIQPRINANIHFLLWDRKISRKEIVQEALSVIGEIFEVYQLNRITATIPACNKGASQLAVLLGMRFEGSMRECFLHNGKYYDLFIYGILRRDFDMNVQGHHNGRIH